MPIFECSRCNDLSYSSSRENVAPCSECDAERKRLITDATTFAEAKTLPRATSYGDHSIAVFDDYPQVAPIARQFIDQAVLAEGLVIAALPQALEDLVIDLMHPDDCHGISWEPPSDTYGPTFSPRGVIDRFSQIAEDDYRPVYVIGCPDEPIQTFTSREDWVLYERLAHETALKYDMTVLCLYDARIHDDFMLRTGLRTHGLKIDEDGEARRNEAFDYEPPSST
jgi:MEDS: MEthanogen/methylotroph, DcmR Sensory domain